MNIHRIGAWHDLYDYTNKDTYNSRDGHSKENIVLSMGEIGLDIPRDRKREFESKIMKKDQTDITNIEDQVLSMCAKGIAEQTA